MKKESYIYVVLFIASLLFSIPVSIFIPPIWAMCDCALNYIRTGLMILDPLIIGALILFFIKKRVHDGKSYIASFFIGLIPLLIIFSILNISITLLIMKFIN